MSISSPLPLTTLIIASDHNDQDVELGNFKIHNKTSSVLLRAFGGKVYGNLNIQEKNVFCG